MMSYTLSIPKLEPLINFEVKIPLSNDYGFHFLLGPNGCGKTLLAKSILGLNEINFSTLYENDQDKILIDDPALRRYLPQNPQDGLFPQFSLEDNVFMLNKLYKIKNPIKIEDIITLLEVKSKNQQVSTLSVGQKKKLLLHFIINSLPEVNSNNLPIIVVLDEPFAGIDKNFSPSIVTMLNEIATKFLKENIFFLIIEHETLVTINNNANIKTATLRKGVDLRIAYENVITLKP